MKKYSDSQNSWSRFDNFGNNFNKNNDPTVSRKEVLDILDELYINYMKEINPELSFEFGLINKIDLKGNKFFEEISGFMIGLN